MTNVAINGLGRIGRSTLKIVMATPGLNLVAANDIGPSDSVAYLLKYDTVYGRYEQQVEATGDGHLKIAIIGCSCFVNRIRGACRGNR